VTNRSSAARYARALFDVSLREADPEGVERDLAAFVDLTRTHGQLGRVLANPAIPVLRKTALVAELTDRAALAPVLKKLLHMLASRDRLVLLGDLLDEYRRRLREHQGVVEAVVTTAVPLPAERLSALQGALAEKTGRIVQMSALVDPAIIGGVVARIGSLVYDGSVRRQLEKMKEILAS
jgi:F-type H+-transporting ATPase subunit delta